MGAPREETRLLQGCIAGDPESWSAFVERYAPLLRSAARKALARGAGPADLDAAFQDVIWELFRDDRRVLRAYGGRSKLTTYLWIVAYRKALESARAAGRRSAGRSIDELPEPRSAEDSPPVAAERRELRALLVEAMQSLPDRDRVILGLYYFECLPLAQISAKTGLTAAAIGMVVHRARGRLEKILKKSGKSPF